MAKKTENEIIQMSVDLQMQEIEACILGTTPFVCNCMNSKTGQQLLYPSGRKSAAEKATSLKHNPKEEYQTSPYKTADDAAPTLITMPAISFKRAMESIALDVPGATKAQIVRNLVAPDHRIALYGLPQLFMRFVRSADMAKTPDIRTRAILPEWACRIRIRYPHPVFREKIVADYLALAGQLRGVGDYRAEKGAGSYGLFEIVDPDDPRYLAVLRNGGRQAQIAAMDAIEFYDDESRDLYEWFEAEKLRRGVKPAGNGTAKEVCA